MIAKTRNLQQMSDLDTQVKESNGFGHCGFVVGVSVVNGDRVGVLREQFFAMSSNCFINGGWQCAEERTDSLRQERDQAPVVTIALVLIIHREHSCAHEGVEQIRNPATI